MRLRLFVQKWTSFNTQLTKYGDFDRLPTLSKRNIVLCLLSRKLKQFKDKEFDIIQIQTPFFMGHLAQYLSWKYDIPMVHTYHTFWIEYLHYFPLIPKNFIRKLIIYLQRTSVTGVIML